MINDKKLRKSIFRSTVVFALFLISLQSLSAVEIRATYVSIQSALEREAFKDEGRHYLEGNSESKCSYAYLERPDVSTHKGRIILGMHFSGHLGTEVFGNCIGVGDSFDVLFSGVPSVQDGVLGLADLGIEKIEVASVLQDQLPDLVKFDLENELKRGLREAKKSSPYMIDLHDFDVRKVRAEPRHLVIDVDFRLEVSAQ